MFLLRDLMSENHWVEAQEVEVEEACPAPIVRCCRFDC